MELILITTFIIKHFICDFPLQKPKHFLNKGTYGHWGGIEHALIHAVGTMNILALSNLINPTTMHLVLICSLIDFAIHYHVDWFKTWWTAKKGYTPQDEMFWIWLGIDQMIHYLTYAFIVWVVCI